MLKSKGVKPLKADFPVNSVTFKKLTLGSKYIPMQGDKQSKAKCTHCGKEPQTRNKKLLFSSLSHLQQADSSFSKNLWS